ncbi:hypothetical protein AJ87_42810 [Rhizobium yanglingense]|nr:hypothetical protein AJ87_42810 [Rhizobium yanglingense]
MVKMSEPQGGVLVFDLDDTLYLESDFAKSGFEAASAWLIEKWVLRISLIIATQSSQPADAHACSMKRSPLQAWPATGR